MLPSTDSVKLSHKARRLNNKTFTITYNMDSSQSQSKQPRAQQFGVSY